MADSSINSFMSNFDGGSRPNLYTVTMTCPGLGLTEQFRQLQFFCRSTDLPSSTLGEIAVPYLGRVAKYPGDRTFEDFTMTIVNTQDMNLRRIFEGWNEAFNSFQGNATAFGNPRAIFGTAVVTQLDRLYRPQRAYQFIDMYPRDVSSINLGYDQNDTVSEFTVTFGYSYYINDNSPQDAFANVGNQGFLAPGAINPGAIGVGNGFGLGANGGGGSGFGFSFGRGPNGSGFSFGYGNSNSSFGFGYSRR